MLLSNSANEMKWDGTKYSEIRGREKKKYMKWNKKVNKTLWKERKLKKIKNKIEGKEMKKKVIKWNKGKK